MTRTLTIKLEIRGDDPDRLYNRFLPEDVGEAFHWSTLEEVLSDVLYCYGLELMSWTISEEHRLAQRIVES